MNLVTTDWLEKNLENVRIFDGSWHLPNSNRNALVEFQSSHIRLMISLLCSLIIDMLDTLNSNILLIRVNL